MLASKFSGEVLGLVGENGAGKSTLMKILSGVYAPEGGQIYVDGQPVTIHDPRHAQRSLGISIIYQEFNLMPNLTVEENVFVGREPNNGRLCASFAADPKTTQSTRSQARSWRDRPRSICGRATNGRNREGAFAQCSARGHGRAYWLLTETEVTALFSIIRGLKARGLAVITFRIASRKSLPSATV